LLPDPAHQQRCHYYTTLGQLVAGPAAKVLLTQQQRGMLLLITVVLPGKTTVINSSTSDCCCDSNANAPDSLLDHQATGCFLRVTSKNVMIATHRTADALRRSAALHPCRCCCCVVEHQTMVAI
jgi:hypothetical protein